MLNKSLHSKVQKHPSGKEVNDIIKLFETLNSSYKEYFNDFIQRSFCTKLLKLHSYEEINELLQHYQKTKTEQYRPTIYSPADLFEKWSKVENYLSRKKTERKFNSIEVSPDKYKNIGTTFNV